MLEFLVERKDIAPFDGRIQYLKAASGFPGLRPRLCHVMEKVNEPLGKDYNESGYPWLTLVLGSGCLEARDADDGLIDAAAASIRTVLQGRDHLIDGTNPAALAEEFAQSLIDDRIGWRGTLTGGRATGTVEPAGQPPMNPDKESRMAVLVLAAALFTRLYHEVCALQPRPMSRAGEDSAFLHSRHQRESELRAELIEPLRQLLREATSPSPNHFNTTDSEQREHAVLAAAIAGVQAGLRTDNETLEVKYAHIRLLTELAWFHMTKNTAVYPGWSDLLQELSMQQLVEQQHPVDFGRTRPTFINIAAAPVAVQDRYAELTFNSWKNRDAAKKGTAAPSSRAIFYDSVARVLRKQASVRSAVTQEKKRPPISSIFVTTFDLELEMALWAAGTEPFVVAMPVNLMKEEGASTCWLGCVITPVDTRSMADQLRTLRKPAPEDWFLISGEGYFGGSERGKMPIVVRLNGCPLISLPKVTSQGRWTPLALAAHTLLFHTSPPEALPEGRRQPMRFEHGVLLDEYTAMQQTAADFFGSSTTLQSNDRVKFGLPDGIAGGMTTTFQRFWMVMGVQIDDSSVRSRFAYQMVAPRMSSDTPLGQKSPKRSGVVVNRRSLEAAARDLLYWYNYDVVADGCESFREDLDHYAEHLGPPSREFVADRNCPIDDDDV